MEERPDPAPGPGEAVALMRMAAAGLGEAEAADALPSFMWVSSEDVAAEAIAAMEKGRAVVIPGAPNRIVAGLAHLTPRRLLLPVLASRHPSLKD